MSEEKTEIYYFNDEGEIVKKEEATNVIVRELDKDGNLIKETRARMYSRK